MIHIFRVVLGLIPIMLFAGFIYAMYTWPTQLIGVILIAAVFMFAYWFGELLLPENYK